MCVYTYVYIYIYIYILYLSAQLLRGRAPPRDPRLARRGPVGPLRPEESFDNNPKMITNPLIR